VAEYHHRLGEAYSGMKTPESAITAYTEAIRIDPANAGYSFSRGEANSAKKTYQAAVDDLARAVSLAPDSARYQFSLGNVYALIGNLDAAEAHYCKAARLDSGNGAYVKKCEEAKIFLDSRDGQKYRTVKIDGKAWMAQNLNYQPLSGKSWCYDGNRSNCDNYGRLYDWNTAKTVCPGGWHLPTRQEWKDLVTAAGVSKSAGKKLKAAAPVWNGMDEHKFSALPGGYRESDGSFSAAGTDGSWWTSTGNNSSNAYLRYMGSDFENVLEMDYEKSNGFSVRCIMDVR
jgi:uncharacterized protein (TIGR02145 family)